MTDEPLTFPEPALLTLIARELATEAYTLEQILERYHLDQEYFDTHIAPNQFYQKVLADYTKEWHSIGSTPKRLAFAAQAALEEKLPILADRMGDRQSGLADAVATAKLFRELAGIAAPTSQPGAQQGTPFNIQINFGGSKIALTARPTEEEHETLVSEESDVPPSPGKALAYGKPGEGPPPPILLEPLATTLPEPLETQTDRKIPSN